MPDDGGSRLTVRKDTSMRPQWYTPLDPECPEVREREESVSDDPIMKMSGCAGEFYEAFRAKHLQECERCREYGAVNIDIR